MGKPGRRAAVACAVVAIACAASAAALETGEIELTASVRLELRRLQDSWEAWTRAYYQNDQEKAQAALAQQLTIAENLGMSKLPDLSIAAAAFAVSSASEGDVERARWVIDGARRLDPERPEPAFARATVERMAGNYPGALVASFEGYAKLFNLPFEGQIWRQNLGVWLLYLVILSSVFFLLLLAVRHGADLFHDLGRLVSPPLDRLAADAVALALLLWPLVLPSGLLWLALYWSILLWGYGSASQRTVLIVLWLALGATPIAVTYQQGEVQKALLPPVRAIENLKAGRLYGSLLLDLEVLRNLAEDSTVATELVADLHRSFGQWEHARLIYTGLVEDHPGGKDTAPALNNLGVYYHRKGDYGTAVSSFQEAIAADPTLAEAYFNLSQAYSQSFNFTEAHQALAAAKQIDGARVALWEDSEGGVHGNVIPIDGGLRRAEEVRRALDDAGRESALESIAARRYLSLAAAFAALALAVALHLLRQHKGYPSKKFTGRPAVAGSRWLSGLVPGWTSTFEGRGARALLAILAPMALALIPVLEIWSYRAPLGFDAGSGLTTGLCAAGLAALFAFRLYLAGRRTT
jgi:tetratricopeptide (TPR) repeat protein